MENKRKVRIVISSLFQDAGEATRALELAKGLLHECPPGLYPELIFFSHGGRFDQEFIRDGFSVVPAQPALPGVGFRQDLKTTAFELIGDAVLAAELLRGELDGMRRLEPDFVLHGFWPVAGMAAKLAGVPEVCYLPLPLEPGAFAHYLLRDLPDFLGPLTLLPPFVRKKIMASVPAAVKLKAPHLRQKNLIQAYRAAGGAEPAPKNLFDMLKADFTVVNDFPIFYQGDPIPTNFAVTGPLFPWGADSEEPDPAIAEVLNYAEKGLRVFCTLGSSGGKSFLMEAIRALRLLDGCAAAILCPPAVCPLDEARVAACGSPNLYLTDRFVPALKVNRMADVVLCHGGQGTLQTAVACGTPVTGFAMQPEQQVNLDHIASFGGGIRLPARQWKAENIRTALARVAGNPEYRYRMARLREILLSSDGRTESAKAVWRYWLSRRKK